MWINTSKSHQSFESPWPIRVDDRGHIASDLACLACGYNLRGLDKDEKCPECGELISQTESFIYRV